MSMNTSSVDPVALLDTLRHLGDDGQHIEAKRARSDVPRDIWETISAFANRSGGVLLLGVDQNAGFAVSGVDDPAMAIRRLGDICSNEMEPPVRATIDAHTVDGRTIVVATVPPTPRAQRPCHHRNEGPLTGSRVRVADGNRRMTEYEASLLLSERDQPAHDREPVIGSSLDDLDPLALERFTNRMRSERSAILGHRSDGDILRMLNVTTAVDDRVVPTLGGLFAFGVFPQQYFPQLNITVVAYPSADAGVPGPRGERFIDNRSVDGNIPTMLSGALDVLRRHMKRRGIVQGMVRIEEWEYPMEVLREAIVNALVHRDYSTAARGTPVQVELYPDRLIVRNPGGLYGPVDETSLGLVTTTSSRNGALLKILEDAEAESGRAVCENRGSGLAAMRAQLGAVGMRPPRFEDLISTFEITITNDALVDQPALDWLSSLDLGPLSPTQMTAMVWARKSQLPLTNMRYREATGVADSRVASRELQELVANGALIQMGSRGSAEYRIATEHRGGRLSNRVLHVLHDGDRSRAELAAQLGADSQQVATALVSLRKQGLVRLIGEARSRHARWALALSPDTEPPDDYSDGETTTGK